MAAACAVSEEGSQVNPDLIEAQIVAQAITELQEIQGPVVHIQGNGSQTGEVTGLVDCDVQTNTGEVDSAETHVIYYIDSNGSFTGSLEKSYTDSSVQANDYEIERRSGRLPARKRIIPSKFRDYKNTSNDEDSDSDFDPHEYVKKPRRERIVRKKPVEDVKESSPAQNVRPVTTLKVRGVGRPRKNFMPATTLKGDSITQDLFTPPPSAEVARKFEEAMKLSAEVKDEVDEISGETSKTSEIAATSAEGSADIPDQDLNVVVKRGRGRPRGPYWKKFYKCPDCGKAFNQKANLRVHLLVHTEDRPFKCIEEGCGKSFRSNEGLRRHLLSHQGIKPFLCTVCKNRFSSNVALIEHQSRHTNSKPHQCPHCDRKFRQVSCLRRHVATHTGRQPYQCMVCQRQFAQPAYLRSHMKIHTGEKPYTCEVCGKKFAHQSDVRRHRTTHTGEKPYSCSKCQAKFSDVSSKNRHEKEHENSKRYTCHLCSDTFKRQGQLRSHLNRRHSHTFAVKIEKDPNNGTFSFKMGDEGDPGSVYFTQKRILSLIKNLQSKSFSETESFALVSVPESAANQTEGTSFGTDISQLEKEVDASVIEGEVGVPVEIQGVEVQEFTHVTISDYAGSWNQAQKTNNRPMQFQKVEVITEEGEKKEMLIPLTSDTSDVDIQVSYADTVDQNAELITIDTQQCTTTTGDVVTESSPSTSVSITTDQIENSESVIHVIDNAKIVDPTNLAGIEVSDKMVTYEVTDKNLTECVTSFPIQDGDTNETITVDGIVIENMEDGSIISMSEPDSEIRKEDGVSDTNTQTEPAEGTVVVTGEVSVTGTSTMDSFNDDIQNGTVTESTVQTTTSTEAGELSEVTTSSTTEVGESNEVIETKDPTETTVVETIGGTEEIKEDNSVDYVANPDFGSQGYYNWLSKFTELCKVVPLPLDVSLFQKISQVHKTLSDVMANPSGVVADRENFRVLMNITKELSSIINEHLVFVLDNLNEEGKPEGQEEDLHCMNV